ncbi:hypothetical protein [Mycetocola zhujimingii]|nr:hypothetical protein [Mycetocola zhujimingii]
MNDRDQRPMAFRATAYLRTSWWSRREVRAFRYDALWADGRVDRDIDLVKVMYQGAPPDFATTSKAMHDGCPDVGIGPWIEYATCNNIPGPL